MSQRDFWRGGGGFSCDRLRERFNWVQPVTFKLQHFQPCFTTIKCRNNKSVSHTMISFDMNLRGYEKVR